MCHMTGKQMNVINLVSNMDLGFGGVLKCQDG
jgi:hypothetical protein